jgi:hypothetical protein
MLPMIFSNVYTPRAFTPTLVALATIALMLQANSSHLPTVCATLLGCRAVLEDGKGVTTLVQLQLGPDFARSISIIQAPYSALPSHTHAHTPAQKSHLTKITVMANSPHITYSAKGA